MATDFGNNQGGVGALASGTPNNPNQGVRPIGWNKLDPEDRGVLLDEANQLRTPSGQVVGGGVILAGQMLIVGRTGTTVSLNSANVAGDTTYQQIASFVVPGGLMGPHGMMRPRLNLRGTNSASTKAFRVRVNGVQIGAELTLTTAAAYQDFAPMLWNKGGESSNEHIASLSMFGGGTSILPTATTIDTSVEMTVEVQARWTAPVAGEFVSMLSGHIEIYPGM